MQAFALQAVHLLPGPGWLQLSPGVALYSHEGCTLTVHSYVPSVLHWEEQGLRLRQLGCWPGLASPRLLVQQAPRKRLTLRLRHPAGCREFSVKVNGRRCALSREPGGSIDITRQWRQGDELVLQLAPPGGQA